MAADLLDGFWSRLAGRKEACAVVDDSDARVPPLRFSHAEMLRRVQGLAGLLAEAGAGPGDRVLVHLPNGIDFVLTYLACLWGGQVVVPVNPALSQDVRAYIAQTTRPVVAIAETGAALAGLDDGAVRRIDVACRGDLAVRASLAAAAPTGRAPGSLFAITFTSGTTGRPKGVCHSGETMLGNVTDFNRLTGLDEATRMLHVLPMAYMAGLHNTILSPLAAGGAIIIGAEFKGLGGLNLWKTVFDHGANTAWLTPTILSFLNRAARSDEARAKARDVLRTLFVGTAPLPDAVKTQFEQTFGVEALESYGMTEVLFVSANTPLRPRQPGSAGPLLPSVEVLLQDQAADGAGTMWIRSPHLFLGYLDPDSGQPQPPHTEQGWFPSGDIVTVDQDRTLRIVGRAKDLIIRGGVNISPRAIEDVIRQMPHVDDVAVVGVPHPAWGEEVAAFVVVGPGGSEDAAALDRHCRQALGPDTTPKTIHFRSSLPKTVTGKHDKNALKRELAP